MCTPRFPKTFHIEVIRSSRGITANVETSYHGVSTHADVFRQRYIFYHADYFYISRRLHGIRRLSVSHRNIGPDQINLQVFFAYVENSVGAIESCLLGRGCGFVKPHPQKTTFNLERKTIWKAARRNIVIVL